MKRDKAPAPPISDTAARLGRNTALRPAAASRIAGSLWPHVAAVLLLPVIVLWHNQDALYSPPWYGDAWFYLGYFRNLLEFKRQMFYSAYYGSRLSWILPGYLIHAVFSPVVANCILHLGVQTVATLSLFSILRVIAGVRSAFLATLVFAVCPWLWAATGWDYVDGAGIAYCLLALALFTSAALQPSRKWTLILAGAALAGMAYTHLFLATLMPLPLLYYAVVRFWPRVPGFRPLLAPYAQVAAGFGIVTALFCGINYFLDGNLWFYGPSLAQAMVMAKNFQYTQPIWHDGLVPWLWPAAAGSIIAIVLLLFSLRTSSSKLNVASAALFAQLLLAVAYMTWLQTRGSTVLGHHPYASYLLPFVFLVLGVSFWRGVEKLTSRTYVLICSASVLAFGALWYDPSGPLVPASPGAQASLMTLAACAFLCALLFRNYTSGTFLALIGFIAFTAVELSQTVHFSGLDLHGNPSQYKRIMLARARIEAARHGRAPSFWFDQEEPNFHEYFGLNATYLAEFTRMGNHFPADCDVPTAPDTLLVVTSQKEHAAETALQALTKCWQPYGVHPTIESVEVLSGSRGPYTLALLGVLATTPSKSSREELFETVALDQLKPADSNASLERWPQGLEVNTPRGFGAFAAGVLLPLNTGQGDRFMVDVRARVLSGKVGFAIFDPARRTFVIERPMWALPEMTEVILPLVSPPANANLIICNRASGEIASSVVIEKIEIRKMP
jgi:hypothetical protein